MPEQPDYVRFLESVWRDKPDELWFLIWHLPEKRSAWFRQVPDAADYVKKLLVGQHDIYWGVGLSNKQRGPTERCPANEVAGLIGLWADVDIVSPLHKKKNLPPDEASARALIDATGAKPTILVHSGHGLQAIWRAREPWIFESEAERTEAAALSQTWQRMLLGLAQNRGWTLDATFDLARVLRLPGTKNHKGIASKPEPQAQTVNQS